MNTPTIRCDFCGHPTNIEEDFVVLEARPAPVVMCEVCKRKTELVVELLARLSEQELVDATPATQLIC